MNRLTVEERLRVVKAMVEGNSLRDTARVTGAARMTIEKLLRDVSTACALYQDKYLRNLSCKRIQCDETWSFACTRQKNAPADKQGEFGSSDVWTWVAMDVDTKLAVSWRVGNRSAATAFALIDDLASRLSHRIQLTTDERRVYLDAVESSFGSGIDYSMLVKIYGATRLTKALSKKVENHSQSVALHFMYYNFVRIHQTLRVTPTMAAGVANKVWGFEDLIALIPN
jgi:hypothetical protein